MATTNYSFTKLVGTDTAGHTSINTCIDSIDTQLKDKTFVPLMVVLYHGAAPLPSGWTDVDAAVVAAGGPASGTGYLWIEKQV